MHLFCDIDGFDIKVGGKDAIIGANVALCVEGSQDAARDQCLAAVDGQGSRQIHVVCRT